MAQRIIITAGASGIGKGIARTFAANGATVCLFDIDAKALDTAAKGADRTQHVTTASLPGLGFANIRVKRKVRL